MLRLALHWQIFIGMLLGAGIGLTVNFAASQRQVDLRVDDSTHLKVRDSANRIEITIGDLPTGREQTIVVDPSRQTPGAYSSLEELEEKDARAYALYRRHGQSLARWIGEMSGSVGGLFLRLLKMISIPLIITSMITGVTGLGHASRLGRMFGRTAGYYLLTSMLAIITGLLMVNLIRPGLRGGPAAAADQAAEESANLGAVLFRQLEAMIPENPIAAVAQGNFLSIISFSILLGVFTILVGGRPAELVREVFSSLFEIMMRMTMAIIRLAPLGVFCLMASATASQGFEVFRLLGWYMLTVAAALAIHALVVLPLVLRFVARRNPYEFAKAMSPALLTAFGSASSNATLPLTLANAEHRAGISNRVGSFVLPLGATINMDGTALYEAVAVLFIAQIYHGASLPLSQQIIVAVTALLASIGAAGIPHAGLVMMTIVLQAVQLPTEMVGLILAVDRVLDMCRTSVNVWSDSCGCAVVGHLEAVAQPTKAEQPLTARATEDQA